MVKQYPHTITAKIVTESHQNENGDWVPGVEQDRVIKGRAEVGGRMVQLTDGNQFVYSWVVYMPKGTTPVPPGTAITVTWDGETLATGNVLLFSQGQLNSRLWL